MDGLLHQIVEGLEDSNGRQPAQGWALLNEAGSLGSERRGHQCLAPSHSPRSYTTLQAYLSLHNNNEEFHLEADQVS